MGVRYHRGPVRAGVRPALGHVWTGGCCRRTIVRRPEGSRCACGAYGNA